MKKIYEKPEVEIIDFDLTDELMNPEEDFENGMDYDGSFTW